MVNPDVWLLFIAEYVTLVSCVGLATLAVWLILSIVDVVLMGRVSLPRNDNKINTANVRHGIFDQKKSTPSRIAQFTLLSILLNHSLLVV